MICLDQAVRDTIVTDKRCVETASCGVTGQGEILIAAADDSDLAIVLKDRVPGVVGGTSKSGNGGKVCYDSATRAERPIQAAIRVVPYQAKIGCQSGIIHLASNHNLIVAALDCHGSCDVVTTRHVSVDDAVRIESGIQVSVCFIAENHEIVRRVKDIR